MPSGWRRRLFKSEAAQHAYRGALVAVVVLGAATAFALGVEVVNIVLGARGDLLRLIAALHVAFGLTGFCYSFRTPKPQLLAYSAVTLGAFISLQRLIWG